MLERDKNNLPARGGEIVPQGEIFAIFSRSSAEKAEKGGKDAAAGAIDKQEKWNTSRCGDRTASCTQKFIKNS